MERPVHPGPGNQYDSWWADRQPADCVVGTDERRRKPTLADRSRPGPAEVLTGRAGPDATAVTGTAEAHSAPVCTESFLDRMPLVQATGRTGAAYNGCLRNAETDLHRTRCLTTAMHF